MKSRIILRAALVAAILLGASHGWAFRPPDRAPLPNLEPAPAASSEAATAEQKAAAAELRAQLPKARVDFDQTTGSPKMVSAVDSPLTGPNGQGAAMRAAAFAGLASEDPHRVTKAFLQQHRKLFGFGPEALGKAKVKREFTSPHNGLKTVVWEQQVDGIPVFEGVLISHTTRKGELVNLSSRFVRDPGQAAARSAPNGLALAAAPAVTGARATALAALNVGEDAQEDAVAPANTQSAAPEKNQKFTAPFLVGEGDSKLTWLPTDGETLRLCWDVILTSRKRGEMFRVLVDAQTGEVRLRHCLTQYISDATYNVFTSDSPSPFSPGYSTPASAQPALVSRSMVTLQAINTTASPNGWIDDGGNETLGNNVDAHTDRNNDNAADLPRPQGSPARVFNFSMDLATQDPTNYSQAAVVQLFYWNNWMHDKLYELGFTEAAGNFQSSNFGRGGVGNDAVQADAQDGGGTDNANFSTPPDGSPGRMQMYIFTGPSPRRDGDLDAEVVLHEYTHGLSNRRVGGGVGMSALQSEGMGEGWSDFYGLSLLSEPGDNVNGCYAAGGYASCMLSSGFTTNYYFGIRRYPYTTDISKNPLTFKDIDPSQASSHTGIPRSSVIGTTANEVHNMGEVWCVTLWEARANLINKLGYAAGNHLILQLVTDGMNLSPANPNFLQARDAILQADTVDNAGANRNELWAAFSKRGMGASATSPASSTSSGVVESYDVPDALLLTPAVSLTATGPVGGPFTPATAYFTLTNSGSSTLNWALSYSSAYVTISPSSGFLTPGGLSGAVGVTVNALANSLPLGVYPISIRFTNQTSGVVQSRVFNLAVVGRSMFDDFEPNIDASQWSSFGGVLGSTVLATNYGGSISSPNSLWFGDAGSRYAATMPINTSAGGTIGFYIRLADGSAWPWEMADALPSEGVVLESSIDGGVNWTEIGNYDSSAYYVWTPVTLSIPVVAQSGATQFRWRQKSHSGSAYDHWALDNVTIDAGPTPPSIMTHPATATIPVGWTANFSVLASGSAPLAYQWRFNGVNMSGATTNPLSLINVQSNQAGLYSVVVTNLYGSATSSAAQLQISDRSSVVGVFVDPLYIDMTSGGTSSEGVNIKSSLTNLGYQIVTFTDITAAAAANSVLLFPEQEIRSLAPYLTSDAKVALSNFVSQGGLLMVHGGEGGAGSLINAVFGLSVAESSQLGGGPTYSLSAQAAGTVFEGGPASVPCNNGTSTLTNLPPGSLSIYENAGLSAVALIPCGAGTIVFLGFDWYNAVPVGTQDGGWLSVLGRAVMARTSMAPIIVMQPANTTAVVGDTATLAVTAAGSSPLSYQWHMDGTNLPGASGSALLLAGVQFSQAGTYSVEVTNAYGVTNSADAILAVTPPPPCAPPPLGLVGWWKAESNALDQVGSNHGTLVGGVTYTAGRVGQEFQFDGSSGYIDFGTAVGNFGTNEFSVEFWLRTSSTRKEAILNKRNICNADTFFDILLQSGKLMFLVDGGASSYGFLGVEGAPIVADGSFHHAVMVREGATLRIYVDGVLSGTATHSAGQVADISSGASLRAGRSPCVGIDGTAPYSGALDEISLYGRALTGAEVQALYTAERTGKCTAPTPPTILQQPTSQVAIVGDSIKLAVVATGTEPMSYQWRLNGTNMAAATSSSLEFDYVRVTNSGTYSVFLSNSVDTALSTNAVLTVNPPPPCAPPPLGLISWWRGETNALDQAGGNNGVLVHGADFDVGVVGRAFRFVGSSNSYVEVPDSPALRFTNALTLECWAKRLNTSEVHNFVEKGGDWTGGQTDYEIGVNDTYGGGAHFGFSFAGGWRGCSVTPDTAWHHYAAVAVSGQVNPTLYIDGVARPVTLAGGPATMMLQQTTRPLHIGAQVDPQTGFNYYSSTLIDEPALYNRALSASEVQAIYNAERSGKCVAPTPPTILQPPISQVATAGDNVTFSVIATGTQPMSYQWRFNGTNLANATAGSLVLTNARLSDSGSYSVFLSNSVNTLLSSNAILTVNPPPPCAATPFGLVSWWRAEGDGLDFAGANHGQLLNGVAFGPGRVGQAFQFDGSTGYISIPASTSLNVGAGPGITIECWINPSTIAGEQALAEWNNGFQPGAHFWISVSPPYGGGPGSIYINLIDTGGVYHPFTSAIGIVQTNVLQHVAMTYDKASGVASLYYNGLRVASQALGSFTPQTSWGFFLGKRTGPSSIGLLSGALDEMSLYKRALTDTEIASIYAAERSGKCAAPTAPAILQQPISQVVTASDSVSFSVMAAGTEPVSYQWRFNGTNLAAATTTSLLLTNARISDAGSYTVLLSNSVGTLLSSNAVLTVIPPPPCAAPPAGLLSWWRGEGSAVDEIGAKNGTLYGGAGFAGGRVGQAFDLTSGAGYVQVPASPSWAFGTNNFSIELWVKFASLGGSRAFVADDQGSYNVNKWVFWLNNGMLQLHLNSPTLGPVDLGSGLFSPVVGRWYHVAVTRSDSLFTFYVDGALNSTATASVAIPDANVPLTIGQAEGIAFMGGFEDELAVYDRSLSGIEIQSIYNAERSGKCVVPTPPVILLQPTNQTVTAQSNVFFSVVAAGTSPLTYQWRRNQGSLAGETNAALFLPAVTSGQAGSYDVLVTNSVGVATSTVAVLTVYVPPPPVFTLQPQGGAIPAGTNYTLTGSAVDTWPIAYQWYLGGAPLSGATNSTLVLTNVQSGNSGTYSLGAANPWSAAMSGPATVTVLPASPSFTLQPKSAAVFAGFPARLDAAAVGTEPLGYQWQFLGSDMPGATGSSFSVSNMLPVNAGSYRAVVTNSVGQASSAEAVLALSPVASLGASTAGLAALPLGITNAVAVSAGAQHNLALRRDGTVLGWGAASQIVIPDGLTNVTAVSAGNDHSIALKGDGTVAAWGTFNTSGQTNVPSSLSNVVAIAAGASHNLALRPDGTVVAWGLNSSGQASVPGGLTNVVAISAGSNHSIALRADGKVFAWGSNTSGQTTVPSNLVGVVSIAAGALHNLALRSDGTVVSWGASAYNRTNVPAGLSNVIAIAAGGFHSLAVKADGTVVAWGAGSNSVASTYPNLAQAFVPAQVTNIVAVSGGDAHSLALAGVGAPFVTAPPVSRVSYSGRRVLFQAAATGARPLRYQWQRGTNDIAGATNQLLVIENAVDAGDYRVVVSNALGAATSTPATLTLVDSLPVVLGQPVGQPVYLGGQTLLQVTVDGSGPLSYQWRLNGTNIAGATGSSLLLNHFLLSQAGNYSVVVSNAFGMASSGKAAVPVVQTVAWGAGVTNYGSSPNYGQSVIPSGLLSTVAIAGGGYHTLAVKADGGLLAWGAGTNYIGNPYWGQSIVPGSLPAVIGAAGGLYHSLAVRADGLVSVWGAGTSNYASPHYGQSIIPAGLSNVVAVAAGDYHSVALKSDGKVLAWGYNSYGISNVPTTVTNVIAIASRANHALALKSDGTVVHWGSTTLLPPPPYNYVAIAAGVNHSLALRSDGTVVTIGGQYPVPTGLSNVVDIAAGMDHSVALKSDGTVVTWGATNTYNRNLIPAGLTNVVGIACGYYHSLAFLGDGSPVVKMPPSNRAAYLGTTTNFAAMVVGAQPMRCQWQYNGADIAGATNATLTLTNLHATDAGNYRVIVSNVHNSATSAVASLTVLVPVGEAVDAPSLVWSTSGNAAWAGESTVTHDGVDAAQSGLLADSQSSTVQTSVTGPGNLTFWCKVSSEEWFDYLTFYIDGVKQTAISGEVAWQQQAYSVGSGSHTLRWTYSKDVSVKVGADAAWLDQVSFVTNAPVITVHPANQNGSMGSFLVLSGAASGAAPLTYQWTKDGTNLIGATSTAYIIPTATRRDSGAYRLVASNPGGTTPSSNATIVVRSPQKLGPPMQLPGGVFALTSGDADGGPLLPGDLPNFQVQATTNFVDWEAVPNCLAITNGVLLLVDPACTNYPRRFYRILELSDASYVTNPPIVVIQPLSQTVDLGAALALTVAGSGAPPLKYQWMKDGTNLAGATSTSLVVSNVTRRTGGEYVAVVSNPVGGRPSSNATVAVHVPGKIEVPVRQPDGTVAFRAGDADGQPLLPRDLAGFQAQTSTNLVDWVPLTNSPVLTNGMLLLRDTATSNSTTRFYRIVER